MFLGVRESKLGLGQCGWGGTAPFCASYFSWASLVMFTHKWKAQFSKSFLNLWWSFCVHWYFIGQSTHMAKLKVTLENAFYFLKWEWLQSHMAKSKDSKKGRTEVINAMHRSRRTRRLARLLETSISAVAISICHWFTHIDRIKT